jgi:hypothetical protein
VTSALERDQKLRRPALAKEHNAPLCRADLATSQADCGYAFNDDELDREALDRFKRIAELRRALEEGQFTLA